MKVTQIMIMDFIKPFIDRYERKIRKSEKIEALEEEKSQNYILRYNETKGIKMKNEVLNKNR